MILTDGVHLVSDRDFDELHRFAAGIGLKRSWYQDHLIPHYDLTTARKSRQAIKAGATKITTRELVKRAIRRPKDAA